MNVRKTHKQESFLAAYEPCKDALNRYCTALAFGKMSAEDLLQDVLASAYENFEKVRRKDQFLHYLIRLARNKSITAWHRSKFSEELLEKHCLQFYEKGLAPEYIIDVQLLFQALHKLPKAHGDALILFEWMGYSIKEIAEIQNSSEGAVKTRLSRARKELRQKMQNDQHSFVLVGLLGIQPTTSMETDMGQLFEALNLPSLTLVEVEDFSLSHSIKQSSFVSSQFIKNVLSFSIKIAAIGLCFLLTQEPFPNKDIAKKQKSDVQFASLSFNPNNSLSRSQHSTFTSTITGTLVDRESKGMILMKVTDDIEGPGEFIPIENNSFRFQFEAEHMEAYRIIFWEEYERRAYQRIIFFPEKEVHFTLHKSALQESSDHIKNRISGGPLNQKYQEFQTFYNENVYGPNRKLGDQIFDLYDKGELYNEKGKELEELKEAYMNEKNWVAYRRVQDEMDELEKQGHLEKSPIGKKLGFAQDSVFQLYNDYQMDYIRNNPNELSYYLLYDKLDNYKNQIPSLEELTNIYLSFAKEMPRHPYTEALGTMISSYQQIQVGKNFVDFTAPDTEGNFITVSDEISGKIALLDLWAPWCGPCIKKSKDMLPVYEEFKDKGFTVVGVVRDYKVKTSLKEIPAIKNYPWKTLLELNNQNKVWLKYSLIKAAGGQFLIDQNGKFLAINPGAREVRRILKERL